MLEFYVRVLHGTVADIAGAEGEAGSEKSEDAGPGTSDTLGTVLLANAFRFSAGALVSAY